MDELEMKQREQHEQHGSDDEDFVPHRDTSKEQQGLLRNTRPPRRSLLQSCCRACVILSSVIIFVLMLIQLWSNYGEYIETRVMAPALPERGSFTPRELSRSLS